MARHPPCGIAKAPAFPIRGNRGVSNSSAVRSPSCADFGPRPYASSSTMAERLMARDPGRGVASEHAGLPGSATQSSFPRTNPWPTICSSAGLCSDFIFCSVASPSASSRARGYELFERSSFLSCHPDVRDHPARKVLAIAAGAGAEAFASFPGLKAITGEPGGLIAVSRRDEIAAGRHITDRESFHQKMPARTGKSGEGKQRQQSVGRDAQAALRLAWPPAELAEE